MLVQDAVPCSKFRVYNLLDSHAQREVETIHELCLLTARIGMCLDICGKNIFRLHSFIPLPLPTKTTAQLNECTVRKNKKRKKRQKYFYWTWSLFFSLL